MAQRVLRKTRTRTRPSVRPSSLRGVLRDTSRISERRRPILLFVRAKRASREIDRSRSRRSVLTQKERNQRILADEIFAKSHRNARLYSHAKLLSRGAECRSSRCDCYPMNNLMPDTAPLSCTNGIVRGTTIPRRSAHYHYAFLALFRNKDETTATDTNFRNGARYRNSDTIRQVSALNQFDLYQMSDTFKKINNDRNIDEFFI